MLELQGIEKRFGAVRALDGVSLTVAAAEVVALVGDNGAGKSTLIKTIAGTYQRDAGTMAFDGVPVNPRNPKESVRLGIATVYQDLALCDNLDVVANLFLGREVSIFAVLDSFVMERRALQLLARLSVQIPDVRTPVGALSGGQRQCIAIARALVGDPKLVVLDEPTAALGVEQTAEVLALIDRLREDGHAVLMVSHNLADVFDVADRIVCLRLGTVAATFIASEVTEDAVVSAITGATDSKAQRRRTKHREAFR